MGTDPRGCPCSGGYRRRRGLDSLGGLHPLPGSPAFGRSQEKGAPGCSEPVQPYARSVRARACGSAPRTQVDQPRWLMLWDAFRSACSTKPQDLQVKVVWSGRFFRSVWSSPRRTRVRGHRGADVRRQQADVCCRSHCRRTRRRGHRRRLSPFRAQVITCLPATRTGSTGTSSRGGEVHYATAVPSSSTIWPGIASRVTPSIVVVGATPAAPNRPASTP